MLYRQWNPNRTHYREWGEKENGLWEYPFPPSKEWMHPKDSEQYTGKKINGVKIWDGDIIRSDHFTDEDGTRHYLYHRVRWSEHFHGWFADNRPTDSGGSGGNGAIQFWVYIKNADNPVIVGNIHQFKELLK